MYLSLLFAAVSFLIFVKIKMNPSDQIIYKLLLEQYQLFINKQIMTRLVHRSLLIIGNIVLSLFYDGVYQNKVFILYAATVLFIMLLILTIIWQFEDSNLKILIEQIEKVVLEDKEGASQFTLEGYVRVRHEKYYPGRRYRNLVDRAIGSIGKANFSEGHFWLLVVIVNYCLLLIILFSQKL